MKNDWFIYLTSCLVIVLFTLLICTQVKANTTNNTVSSTVTGTTTIDKTPPSAISPSVVVNNSDICKTAVAGSVQTQVFGISSGVTVRDENCEAIKLSRALASLGLKVGAVSILAQNDARVFDSLWLAGTYPPINGKIGMEAKELWLKPENRHLIPEGSKVFSQIPIVEVKTEGVDEALFFKTLFIITTGLFIF